MIEDTEYIKRPPFLTLLTTGIQKAGRSSCGAPVCRLEIEREKIMFAVPAWICSKTARIFQKGESRSVRKV